MATGSANKSTAASGSQGIETKVSPSRYRRLWLYSVCFTAVVSLSPLVVIMHFTFYQYKAMLTAEMKHPISRLASNSRRFLAGFLAERRAALTFVANREKYEDLRDPEHLGRVFLHMKTAFGGFIDLGLIDADGEQLSYTGPYELAGKDYHEQDWYHEVSIRGVYVSNVFLGHRKLPHFVIAVRKYAGDQGGFYILRATIDADVLNRHISSLDLPSAGDAFLINHEGILQTPSKHHGDILERCPIETPPPSSRTEVREVTDVRGEPGILGYAYIAESPFIFVMRAHPRDVMRNWLRLRRQIVWLTAVSIVLIVAAILAGCTYLVRRIRDADYRRSRVLHNVEYMDKMASIGRMAAGVAHEINNPLAIVGENAGLLKDLVSFSDEPPQRERVVKIADTVLKAVERCSLITHRLLGFAKRMDPLTERIALGPLIEEILSFQAKEAESRNIEVNLTVPDILPTVESDRGQLQQVFVNILGNALAAVDDGGHIGIALELEDEDHIAVTISDDGPGIPEEHLNRIFEPFFSTKGEYGTGLGLSITFGIVSNLGGRIDVHSAVGQGASFTVRLPIKRRI